MFIKVIRLPFLLLLPFLILTVCLRFRLVLISAICFRRRIVILSRFLVMVIVRVLPPLPVFIVMITGAFLIRIGIHCLMLVFIAVRAFPIRIFMRFLRPLLILLVRLLIVIIRLIVAYSSLSPSSSHCPS